MPESSNDFTPFFPLQKINIFVFHGHIIAFMLFFPYNKVQALVTIDTSAKNSM
jgi:hypothetical protein